MGKGRKSLPETIKNLQGSVNSTRVNKSQLSFDRFIELPEMPAGLKKEGIPIYETLGHTIMNAGILNPSNLILFISLCNEWGLYVSLEKEMPELKDRFDTEYRGEHSYQRISHKHKMSKEALMNAHKLAVEFGLTPASISKIITVNSPKKNPIDELLND